MAGLDWSYRKFEDPFPVGALKHFEICLAEWLVHDSPAGC